MRRPAKWAIRLLLISMLVAGGVGGTLATHKGQSALLNLLSWIASDDRQQLVFGPLEGSLFSKGRLARISASDRAGEWLVVRNVSFDWQPVKLLLGRLHVTELYIANVDVMRTPQGGNSVSGSKKTPRPIPASIDRFEISQIALDEAVIGVPARFKLTAAAHLDDPDRGADARLQVERLDAPDSSLTAVLNFGSNENRLTISAKGHEAPGGIVAQLVGLPATLPLSVALQGNGTLDAWRGAFSVKASDTPFIAGSMAIDRAAASYGLTAHLDGYLDAIAPQDWRGLLSGKTSAELAGALADSGHIVVDKFAVSNDALSLTGAGQYRSPDGDLVGRAQLDIARADGRQIPLPFESGASSSIASLRVAIDLPETKVPKAATLALSARTIVTGAGSVEQLDVNGKLDRSSDRWLEGPFKLTASLGGLTHANPNIAGAIGEEAVFSTHGNIAKAGRADIQAFAMRFASGNLEGNGTLEGGEFKGRVQVSATELKPLAQLAGIDAAGTATFEARGAVSLHGEAMDVAVSAASTSLTLTGKDGAIRDFGAASLAFKASREHGGPLTVRGVEIWSKAFKAHGHMTIADAKLDGEVHADLSDLAVMFDEAEGKAKVSAKISGTFEDLHSHVLADGRSITVAGRSITDFVGRLDGSGPLGRHAMKASINAVVTGQRLEAQTQLLVATDAIVIDDMTLDWGALAVRGNARLNDKSTEGRFHIEHGNLSQLKALVGTDLAGKMNADVDLVTVKSGPAARVKLVFGGASIAGASFGNTDITATVPLNEPLHHTEATTHADNVVFEQAHIGKAKVEVEPGRDGLRITMTAKAPDTGLDIAGHMQMRDGAMVVSLENFRAQRNGRALTLARQATARLSGGTTTFSNLSIQSGDGRLDIDGKISRDSLDINARLAGIPAALLDMVAPSIGATGRLSGSVRVRGAPPKPTIDFDAVLTGASARTLQQAGLPPIELRANGQLAGIVFSARLEAAGYDGLSIASQLRLSGKDFNELTGTINGRAPLKIANAMLAERGTRLSGEAHLDAKLGGTLGKPTLDGHVRIENASAQDTSTGTVLQQISGNATISESSLDIVGIRGIGDKGGEMSAKGTLSWSPTPPELQNLSILLSRLKIDDKKQVSGEIDGSLVIDGPLDNLIATGRVDLKRLDVLVPERLPRSVAALNLKHLNAPGQIAERTERANKARSDAGQTNVGLQIAIYALDRITVRGRGLDALLGGELKLRGTAGAPMADGAFELVRGRLSLLGRQLDFQRGSVAFAGTLEPYLDLEAGTEADGVSITVNVTGPASQPEFKFSSQPDLPGDEILARLVFNKALVKLTPIQIAQLASEIDKIGGLSSGPGLLDQLKTTVGIDRLDMTTEKDGSTAISAGSYVGDSTYVGVRQGLSASSSRIVIDHDLTKNLKARGEIGADGNSKLGIGVEWDY